MKTNHPRALFFLLAAALSLTGGMIATVRAQDSGATTQPSRAGVEAQTQANVQQQRQAVQQQAEQSVDPDAVAAIQETENAIKAIAAGKNDEAMAAIERASGKINVLVGRNPAAALLAVQARVDVIDVAPLDVKAIRTIAKAAERAVADKDYPQARPLLESLISELRVRTYHLPLATYPTALRDAARLLDEKKPQEAAAVLDTALHTLVIVDRVSPLPILTAQEAIRQAEALRDKDKNAALAMLALARDELDRAKELGYAAADPNYDELKAAVNDVEGQIKKGENSESAFGRLRDKIASAIKRLTGSEKKSQ